MYIYICIHSYIYIYIYKYVNKYVYTSPATPVHLPSDIDSLLFVVRVVSCFLCFVFVCIRISYSHVFAYITVSTGNATPPKFTKSRNSNSSLQIQIKPEFYFACVPRDTDEFYFVKFGGFRGCGILSGTCNICIDSMQCLAP